MIDRLEQAHPGWLALVVAAVAAAYRVGVFLDQGDGTFEGLLKGVPRNDAFRWNSMAADFARGDGWDGSWGTHDTHRPLYWLVMGSIYALTGPSVDIARAVQIGFGIVSSVLIFECLRRIVPVGLAVFVALTHSLSRADAQYALTTLTEPLGTVLANAALCTFVVAVDRLRSASIPGALSGTRVSWQALSFLSGAWLGLSNLARPLTQFAAVLLPLAACLALWPINLFRQRAASRRLTPWQLLLLTLLVPLGFLLTMAPWMIRQRVKYGVWSVSANSAAGMFAATSPGDVGWGAAARQFVNDNRSVREQTEFFNREVRRHLREHPGEYLRKVALHALRVSEAIAPSRVATAFGLALLAFLMLAAAPRGAPTVRTMAGVAVLGLSVWFLPPGHQLWLCAAGCVLALLRAHPVVLIATFCLSGVATIAILAISGMERYSYMLQWSATLLALWLFWEVLCVARSGRFPPSPWKDSADSTKMWGAAARPLFSVLLVFLGIIIAGSALALHRGLKAKPPRPPLAVAEPDAGRLIDAALAPDWAEPFRVLRPYLTVRRARIDLAYAVHLEPRESLPVPHPALSEPRPYGLMYVPTWPGQNRCIFAGEIDTFDDADAFLVGVALKRQQPGQRFAFAVFEVISVFRVTDDRPAPTPELPSSIADAKLHADYVGRLVHIGSPSTTDPDDRDS